MGSIKMHTNITITLKISLLQLLSLIPPYVILLYTRIIKKTLSNKICAYI